MGTDMKLRNIVFGFIAASLLAGCSIFERKQADVKAGAVQVRPLEVPPDLTVPETEQRYTIPGTDEKVASFSEYTKRKEEQPCVAPAATPAAAAPAQTPSARLQESNGIKSILLGEPFDRSWRRVGLALDHAKLVTTDKDRSKGIFFVPAAPGKDSKEKRPDYQVLVRETNGSCEVTVVDQNGKSDAETARLIEVVYQNLDKTDRGEGRPPRGDAVRRSR